MDARPPLISFLSDYGLADPFVGLCHAQIALIAPLARVVDLTHGVPAGDVPRGALLLADCLPYLPAAVHLAVVDPGVGTDRRALALAAGDHRTLLVGPDNGLLWPAARRLGLRGAWELAEPRYRRTLVSATFHGRDVFAPAAAHLAAGVDPAALGPPVDLASLARLELPEPRLAAGRAHVQVLAVDGYGNLQLSLSAAQARRAGLADGAALTVHARGAAHRAVRCATFGDVAEGGLALLEDSFGRMALSVNRGSAADALGVGAGDRLRLSAGALSAPGAAGG